MNISLRARNVASALGTAVLFMLSGGSACDLRAADQTPSVSPASAKQEESPADLILQLPIKGGPDESAQFKVTVPGFTVASAKLHFHPGTARTRLMIGVCFTSRLVSKARLEVTLLQGGGVPLTIHHLSHAEALGPEQVRRKGHNLDLVHNWDTARALWFDVPMEARRAEVLRVEVHLQRGDDSGGP